MTTQNSTNKIKPLKSALNEFHGHVIRPSQLRIKELLEDEGEFYSSGFVATTHPDRAGDDGYDGDILTKEAIEQITAYINKHVATANGPGATRIVSNRHDWIKEQDPNTPAAGVIVEQEEGIYAKTIQLKDGHWGTYVKVHHNKNHPKYEEIVYDVKHGYLPGYSIEYLPGEFQKVSYQGKTYRLMKSIADYVGHAFAHARLIANPSAIINSFGYKEILALNDVDKLTKEESNMNYEELKKKQKAGEELSDDEKSFIKAEEAKASEKESSTTETTEVESKETTEEVKEEVEVKEQTPAADVKETAKANPKIEAKEVVDLIRESPEYKEALNNLKPKTKVLNNKQENKGDNMNISVKEMIKAHQEGKVFQAKEMGEQLLYGSARVKETLETLKHVGRVQTNSNFNVKVSGKGLVISSISTKDTLVTGDNTSSYTQEDVEFADVFAAGIIDTFNNQTNLFGWLGKEQHAQGAGEYVQWKMVTNKDPNSDSTFVATGTTAVTGTFSSKQNYQTPLKIARRTVSVSDFVNRYSAQSLGDLFALELDLQMKELMNDVNAALFAEVADGAGVAPLGLEAVADSAGNTTLYGKTRSTANRLAPDSAADTYLAVGGALTEAALRAKIRQLEIEGTRPGDIAIIASPASKDFIFDLLDGNRRFVTTEAAFGFNRLQVPTYDGIPIIVDSDCNADAIYVVDADAAKIVIGMEPQIIELAKVGMSAEAVVEMHFAFVYKQPRRIGMLDTLA